MEIEYQNAIKNVNKTLVTFGEQINKVIGDATKAFTERMLPWLQSLTNKIPELSLERKKQAEEFCEKMLGFGWVVSDFVSSDVYNQNLQTLKVADKYFFKYCTRKNLGKIFKSLCQSSILQEDIKNIKSSFYAKAYKACCSLIVSNLEHYIINEYNITENCMLKQNSINKIKELNKDENLDKYVIFTYLHNYSLYLGLNAVFKNVDNLKQIDDSDFSVPSRHCLQHGYSKRKYTKKDCWFLISLLYGFVKQKQFLTSNLIEGDS